MRIWGHRRRWLAVAAVLALAIGAGAFFAAGALTQDERAGEANGIVISVGDISSAQTVTARVRLHDPGYTMDLAAIARRKIDYEEATRRGFTCTLDEARAQIGASVETAQRNGFTDGLLQIIEDSGDAVSGYHLTPEADRIPPTDAVIAAYRADPNVLAASQRLCAVGKLMQSVEDASKPLPGTLVEGQSPNVVATFRAELYARAMATDAEGNAIDISLPTATPSP